MAATNSWKDMTSQFGSRRSGQGLCQYWFPQVPAHEQRCWIRGDCTVSHPSPFRGDCNPLPLNWWLSQPVKLVRSGALIFPKPNYEKTCSVLLGLLSTHSRNPEPPWAMPWRGQSGRRCQHSQQSAPARHLCCGPKQQSKTAVSTPQMPPMVTVNGNRAKALRSQVLLEFLTIKSQGIINQLLF